MTRNARPLFCLQRLRKKERKQVENEGKAGQDRRTRGQHKRETKQWKSFTMMKINSTTIFFKGEQRFLRDEKQKTT